MPRQEKPWQDLSGRCFISHSYADSSAVQQLREHLPKKAEPVIFERVQPDPTNAVSDGIIPVLLSCNSLIHLERGQSANSFWVSFERDYALRSGLDVYAYDPYRNRLCKDDDEPLDLDVSTFFHQNDRPNVDALVNWMRDERHFDLSATVTHLRAGSMSGDAAVNLEEQLRDGGVVLCLAGTASAGTIDHVRDPGFRSYLRDDLDFFQRFRSERMAGYRDRQDPHSPFKFKDDEFYIEADPHDYLFGVHARIDSELGLEWQPAGGNCLDLLSGQDDPLFNWNRVDDLIVRLYEALIGYRRRCAAAPPDTHTILEDDLSMLPIEWADRRGRQRLRLGATNHGPTWKHNISQAQDLIMRAANTLTRAFGHTPTTVDSRLEKEIPYDPGFPAHYTYIWNWYPHYVELSMDIDGQQAIVYVRRVPIPKEYKKHAKQRHEDRMAKMFSR